MITLEQLVEELDINQIDEVLGGTGPGGKNTWWDAITTAGGTSGHIGTEGTTMVLSGSH